MECAPPSDKAAAPDAAAPTLGPVKGEEAGEGMAHMIYGKGWPGFWVFVVAFVASTTLLAQMLPGISLRYFNGWRGDPCAAIGSLSVDCQIATMKSLEVQGTYGMAKNVMVIISSPFIGVVSDSTGRMPLIWGGVSIAMVTVVSVTALYFQVLSIQTFYIAQMLTGLIPVDLLTNLWITDRSLPHQRVVLYGVVSAVFSGEGIIVPFVSAFLSRWGCMEAALICFAVTLLSLGAGVPESLARDRRQPLRLGQATGIFQNFLGLRSNKGYRVVVLLSIIIVGTQTCVGANIQILLRERYGLNRQQTMPIVTSVGLVTLFSQLFLVGPLVKLFGLKGMLRFGVLVLATAHFVLAIAPSYTVSFMACCAAGVGFIATPALMAIVMNLASTKQRGAVQGAYTALMNLGIAVFTFVYTRLHAYFARPRLCFSKPFPGFPLLIVAALELAAILTIPLFWHHVEEAEKEAQAEEARESEMAKDLVAGAKLAA